MDKLLEFLDRLCIDEKLYWRVPYADENGTAEISWRRDGRPETWSIRERGAETSCSLRAAELPETLKLLGIDISAFEKQLGASILTQAVFADMVLEGAIRLFGSEVVSRSINDTREFLAMVSDAAARMTKVAPLAPTPRRQAPVLRLVGKD